MSASLHSWLPSLSSCPILLTAAHGKRAYNAANDFGRTAARDPWNVIYRAYLSRAGARPIPRAHLWTTRTKVPEDPTDGNSGSSLPQFVVARSSLVSTSSVFPISFSPPLPITQKNFKASIGTALPAITHDLHSGATSFAWVSSSYTLAATAILPLVGRIADIFGRRTVRNQPSNPLFAHALVRFLSSPSHSS